jgi:hypothetical protein
MNRFKFYLITSYIFGVIFFLIHNFNFEFFILFDPLIFVIILNIPSLIIGSIFSLLKKKLFWIFYAIMFFLVSSVFIFWTVVEIYTGGDWGKIL